MYKKLLLGLSRALTTKLFFAAYDYKNQVEIRVCISINTICFGGRRFLVGGGLWENIVYNNLI